VYHDTKGRRNQRIIWEIPYIPHDTCPFCEDRGWRIVQVPISPGTIRCMFERCQCMSEEP
jgi:hypothetical protein